MQQNRSASSDGKVSTGWLLYRIDKDERLHVTTAREDNVMRRIVVRSPMGSIKKIRAILVRRGMELVI